MPENDSEQRKEGHSPERPVDLETALRRRVLDQDDRYHVNAYRFVYGALARAQQVFGRNPGSDDPAHRHVTGRELLEGARQLAIEEFGPLAPAVFRSWGVHRTEDFGEIVFNLVEANLMGKTDTDTREDFANGFDFDKAFDLPVKVR